MNNIFTMGKQSKKQNKKHDCLCDLVASLLLATQGGDISKHVEYKHGEMDIVHTILDIEKYNRYVRVYYEIKSNYSDKTFRKGERQIRKAIRYGMCDWGYIVSPQKTQKVI